jgi:hypothetical protein
MYIRLRTHIYICKNIFVYSVTELISVNNTADYNRATCTDPFHWAYYCSDDPQVVDACLLRDALQRHLKNGAGGTCPDQLPLPTYKATMYRMEATMAGAHGVYHPRADVSVANL